MTIMFEGGPILVKCVSRDDDMLLHVRTDTKTDGEYVYNVYSHRLGWESYSDGIIKFHKNSKFFTLPFLPKATIERNIFSINWNDG